MLVRRAAASSSNAVGLTGQSITAALGTLGAVGLPLWRQNLTNMRWTALATELVDVDPCPDRDCAYSGHEGFSGVTEDYSGMVMTPTRAHITWCGGHDGYGGNEALGLDLSQNTPAWAREVDPSTSIQIDVAYYADGKPSSRHSYGHHCFIPAHITGGNRIFAPFASFAWGNAGTFLKAASYVPGSGTYDPANTFVDYPGNAEFQACVEWDSATERVFIKGGNQNAEAGCYSFNPATNSYTNLGGQWNRTQGHLSRAIDPVRRIFLCLGNDDIFALDLDDMDHGPYEISTTGSALPAFEAPGVFYDPISECFITGGSGATLKAIIPAADWRNDPWEIVTLSNVGGGATPSAGNVNGTYGRLGYSSAYRAIVLVNKVSEPTWVYGLPAGSVLA